MTRVDFGETMASAWDEYIRRWRAEGGRHPGGPWPGDQWGTPAEWAANFKELVTDVVPPGAERFVEIGPGAGKYTALILDAYPAATVRAADVSGLYLEVLAERLAPAVAAGRVVPVLLDADPDGLRRDLATASWMARVDCVCSFDALVHVDLQYMVAYLALASACLRPGGVFSTMLADATSDAGHAKLLTDIRRVWPYQGRACHQFQWVSPDIVRSVFGRLDLQVERCRPEGAYIYVVARKPATPPSPRRLPAAEMACR
jgi:SAM-dependent methyltransferase